MKTIEEIKKHLSDVKYDAYARHAIYGFLVGNGDIEDGEYINWKDDDDKDFSEFMDWYKSPKCYFDEGGCDFISKETADEIVNDMKKSVKYLHLQKGLQEIEGIVAELEKSNSKGSPLNEIALGLANETREMILGKIKDLEL